MKHTASDPFCTICASYHRVKMVLLTRKLLLLVVVSIIQYPSFSRADYQLQVRAVSYANPSSRRSNGDCCDLSISCSNDCDTHLDFCFRPPGYSDAVDEECPLGILTAGSVGGDSITFGSRLGRLPNPFTITVQESWLGSFQILVEVFDADDITNDDFVDVIFGAPFNLSVGSTATQTYSGRRASITFTFQVSCSSYYYGPNCDVFCEEMDNDIKGRYTCDPRTGEKVCRPGYTDPASNCVTAITEEPLEPVTTTREATAVTVTQDGTTESSSMATATESPKSASTSTGPGVLGILVSTTDASPDVISSNTDINSATNRETNGRKNIGVIVGPLVAIIVIIATIIVALVIVLICKRYRNPSKFSSDDLTVRMLPTFNDGMPNATYDPTATGVVYAGRGTNTERNFDNPLYQPAKFTHTSPSGAAASHISNDGHSDDEDHDSKSSSGLYSTIDHRSPRRTWALRPPQNGQYSVITYPH